MGVEIEGGWQRRPNNYHEDGSVHGTNAAYYGEIVSRPLLTREAVKRFIKENYPDKTNRTCGFHIHVSFKNSNDYKKLMTKKFYNIFLENAREWGKENKIKKGSHFWKRLNGQNNWCKSLFGKDSGKFLLSTIDKQYHARGKCGPRYYHLNFCKDAHNTVECRLFPTFEKATLSAKAVDFFWNLCNNYVTKTKEVPKRMERPKLSLIKFGRVRDAYGWCHVRNGKCRCLFKRQKYYPVKLCKACKSIGVKLERTNRYQPFEKVGYGDE